MMNKETVKYLVGRLRTLYDEHLSSSQICVLHCAAGVHRTGTLAYTILRMSGYDASEAFELLGTMREETKKGVGDWRIELAEKHLVPLLTLIS